MTMVFNSSVQELGDELDQLLHNIRETMSDEDKDKVDEELQQDKEAWIAKRDRIVTKGLECGLITAWITKKEIRTKDVTVPNGTRANWFPMASLMGLEHPAIVTVENPEEPTAEAGAVWVEEVKNFLTASGLRAYTWTMGDNTSMYVAERKAGTYLPENIDEPREKQSSISGFTFEPGAIPGKVSKPLRALGMSAGTVLSTEPSTWSNGQGKLNLPDGKYGIIRSHDTKGAGDGGGIIKESFARKLLRSAGLSYSPTMYGLYIVAIGKDFAFKGFLIIQPDQRFPTRGENGEYIPLTTDMLVDSESFKKVVFNTKFTIVKVTPHTVTNQGYHFVTPLIQLPLFNRFVNYREAAQKMPTLADKVFADHWKKAAHSDHTDKFVQVPQMNVNPEIITQIARLNDTADDGALAYATTGNSMAASPGVMRRIVAKPLNNWLRHDRKAAPAPATFASGETVYAVYPFYAGVTEPEPGYARMVFGNRNGRRWKGIALNRIDHQRNTQGLDTLDFDSDRVTGIPLDNEGVSEILIMRTPQSIDGGLCLKLYENEAERLASLGYDFHKKQAGNRWPGLYEIDLESGDELYPAMLKPPPFENPPKWTNNEEEGIQFLCDVSPQRGHLGQLTNMLCSLDWAGHFTPEWKFRFSTDGVDHMINCDADTGATVETVKTHIYNLVTSGKRFDPCTYGRISKLVENKHAELHGEEAKMPKPFLKCNSEDPHLKMWTDIAITRLMIQVKHAINMANGPVARLTAEVPESTVKLAAKALTARNKNWAITLKKCDTIALAGGPNHEDEIDKLFEAEKKRDIDIIRLAQLRASWAKDYRPGDFMSAWMQMTLTKSSRFDEEGDEHEEISIHSLEKGLTEKEKLAYYSKGSQPGATPLSAIVPVEAQMKSLYNNQKCKVITKSVKGERKFFLATPSGKRTLAQLGPSAQNYEGYPLKVVGFVPDYSDLMKQADCLVLKIVRGNNGE